jgi:hypothetical protein
MKKVIIVMAAIAAVIMFINYRQKQRNEAFHQESQRNLQDFIGGFVSGWNEAGPSPGAAVRREIETYQPPPTYAPKKTFYYDANGNPVGTSVQY